MFTSSCDDPLHKRISPIEVWLARLDFNMAAEVITKFLADLVNATSDCVQAISDQCLAKGLITRSTYDRVLESGATSKDKARILILAVQGSIKTDGICFDMLLEILDEQLPPASKQKLLLEMRKEHEDRAMPCKALIPSHSQQTTESEVSLTVASLHCVQQQSSLLGRFENSVSRLAYSSAQKSQFENKLQSQVEESSQLRDKLETLESQLKTSSLTSKTELSNTKSRISACEAEMGDLKRKIEELKCIIEEESMQAKRGRNTIRMETKRLIDRIVQQSQREIKEIKMQEHQKVLKMQEADAKIKELEHKLALQEKELQIKEVELGQERRSYQPTFEATSTQQGTDQNSSEPSADTESSVPSLQDLLKELYPIANKWEDIGILLNIESVVLRRIKSDNSNDSKAACLREMLRIWLKVTPHPSWSAIAEAIELLGNENLADRLRTKHCHCTRLTEDHHSLLFEQLSSCADQWRRIGVNLKFTEYELNEIGSHNLLAFGSWIPEISPKDSLREMLAEWLQWAPGDARGSTNFATLEALKDALRKAGLGTFAQDPYL